MCERLVITVIFLSNASDVIAKFKNEFDLESAQTILNCGGILIPFFVLSVIILSTLSCFGWIGFILGIIVTFSLMILGINLNSKFHQLLYDLRTGSNK